jgi:hypothetical protein
MKARRVVIGFVNITIPRGAQALSKPCVIDREDAGIAVFELALLGN